LVGKIGKNKDKDVEETLIVLEERKPEPESKSILIIRSILSEDEEVEKPSRSLSDDILKRR